MAFPGGSDSRESTCNTGHLGSIPGSGRSPEKGLATHSSVLAWRIHGQRSLGGFSPWGCKESDTTERLTHTHTHTQTHKQTRSTVPYKDGFRQSLSTYAVRCVKGTCGRNICKLSLSTFFQWVYQDMFLDQQSLPFSTCRHHLRV